MYGSFYGWYFKCQSKTQTLAIIPAIHRAGRKSTCSIQLITHDNTWTVEWDGDDFYRDRKNIVIGNNQFSRERISLEIDTKELQAKGELKFQNITPLKYDIMGPFALLPWMECRHSVYSMRHFISGTLNINGNPYSFENDLGYWEGDSGYSFPKKYLWTQCCFDEGTIMLAVADIPILGFHFTGIIGVVLWNGKEERIATYCGAKVKKRENQTICIKQGKLELEAQLLEDNSHPLKAPTKGKMVRTIHESVACKARYRFSKGGQVVFEKEVDNASFEIER
jgi:hypothetical protein